MVSCSSNAHRTRDSVMPALVIAIVACFLAPAAYAAPAHTESVAFTSSPRGHLLVPVSINGSEALIFALDTGAGKTLITPRLAQTLGLAGAPSTMATTLGVHGSTENPAVELPSVAVGKARVTDVRAIVLDLDHITRGQWRLDGVLGMDFLTQFDVRLDFRASTVSFYSPALKRSECTACPAGVDGIAFDTIDPGFIVLPASVDERPVKAVLDTGAGHSGLNGRAAAALGATLPAASEGAPTGHGFGLQTGPVRLGDSTLSERPTLHVMDHPTMEALGLAELPTMLMGTDQLAGRAVTICYGLGTLYMQ